MDGAVPACLLAEFAELRFAGVFRCKPGCGGTRGGLLVYTWPSSSSSAADSRWHDATAGGGSQSLQVICTNHVS